MTHINSIRTRMTVSFLLVLTPFLLLACLIVVLVSSRIETVQSRVTTRHVALQAKKILREPGWQEKLAHLMAQRAVREHGVGLLVLNRTRRIIWSSSDGLPMPPVPPGGLWHVIVRKTRRDTLFAYYPTPGPLLHRTREINELFVLSLCVLLVTSAGAWALVGYTLRPIHQLSQQAEAGSASSADIQLTAPSQDFEVVELVGTLNGLLYRQARAAATKGRFYAAASHELRTPLQALSGHLELALSQPRTREDYQTALEEAQGQTQRLISLVRALLLLHQIEGESHLTREPVEISTLCHEYAEMFQERNTAHQLEVKLKITESAVIEAVLAHAQMLVRNLLENAFRYTPPGGKIEVSLMWQEKSLHLLVRNDCLIAADEDPQTWLEPFHRPDNARTANTGGNGLGLTICRAIAEANGWKMELSQEPDGLLVHVEFLSSSG